MAKNNVDLFKASKAMSDRVADFMQKKVWGITLKSRIKREIMDLENKIVNLENLRRSILDEVDPKTGENKIDMQIEAYQTKSENKQQALKDQLEAEAKFEFSDNDKAFYKAYKAAKTTKDIKEAIAGFLEEYGLENTEGTTLVNDIANAISGKKRSTARTIIKSEAKKFNDDKRTKNDVLIILYGELAEAMLNAGTLKPVAIQTDVREFYAPKKKHSK